MTKPLPDCMGPESNLRIGETNLIIQVIPRIDGGYKIALVDEGISSIVDILAEQVGRDQVPA